MIPNWEKRLFEARKTMMEQEAKRRLRGSLTLSPTAGSQEQDAARRLLPTVTDLDQICFELIREMDLADRAERIRLAAKPGLNQALTEAGLLRSKQVWPQRKTLPNKPKISTATKWKVQVFEPPMAWMG
eukprot:symbB.v1.2.002116.t1/scaffold106.1/size366728/4